MKDVTVRQNFCKHKFSHRWLLWQFLTKKNDLQYIIQFDNENIQYS